MGYRDGWGGGMGRLGWGVGVWGGWGWVFGSGRDGGGWVGGEVGCGWGLDGGFGVEWALWGGEWQRYVDWGVRRCCRLGVLEVMGWELQCVWCVAESAVSRVNTTTSSSSPSPDITALTDIVKELVLMNTANQQASVKAVEETCVTCGGPHPYYECLATDSNIFNASATTRTYNQGGNRYRPQGDPNYRASNQMGPSGFPPTNVQNNQNYNRYNQNQGNYQALNNQGRGQNFNQGNNNYQALNYQAPNYQAQVGHSNELTNYMKSNEATLRSMQTQMTNMKTELQNEFKSSLDTRTNKIENQNNQIMNMLTNLTMQKQNPSGSGSLPSNTVANPERVT
ncbi:hypothetical protein Tco_1499786 [Tanacetum coccineum]